MSSMHRMPTLAPSLPLAQVGVPAKGPGPEGLGELRGQMSQCPARGMVFRLSPGGQCDLSSLLLRPGLASPLPTPKTGAGEAVICWKKGRREEQREHGEPTFKAFFLPS